MMTAHDMLALKLKFFCTPSHLRSMAVRLRELFAAVLLTIGQGRLGRKYGSGKMSPMRSCASVFGFSLSILHFSK